MLGAGARSAAVSRLAPRLHLLERLGHLFEEGDPHVVVVLQRAPSTPEPRAAQKRRDVVVPRFVRLSGLCSGRSGALRLERQPGR